MRSKREIVVMVLVLAAVAGWRWFEDRQGTSGQGGGGSATATMEPGEAAVLEAFRSGRSDVIVEVEGEVVKLLREDREGVPHQKFLLELSSGHTLLISHNLNLADRVPLREGDRVSVKGEYEHTKKGGVVHWTHDDPAHRHPHGWIKHKGRTYQ